MKPGRPCTVPSHVVLFAKIAVAVLTSSALLGCGGDDTSASPGGKKPAADAGIDQGAPDADKPDGNADVVQDAPPADAGLDALIDGELDSDGDGVPDSLDACPGFDDAADADGDGIADGCDPCPTGDNDIDSDGDGFADGCDICPGFDESIDSNGSGVPDCRQALRLWLRADRGVLTDDGSGGIGPDAQDEEPVRRWQDQGVSAAHGDQTNAERQPVFVSSALPNGLPAIRFTGNPSDTVDDDSLDGPFLVQGKVARTVFIVARDADPTPQNTSILELNRGAVSNGGAYRATPEIGVRLGGGNAIFSNQPLRDRFRVITLQNDVNASSNGIRAWFDGIRIEPASATSIAINTGAEGYRLGDGNPIGQAGFTGEIAEVIVYQDALNEAERDGVGLTLERKYDLQTYYIPEPKPLSVYVLAGQSNMVGQGDAAELSTPLDAAQGDVMLWNDASVGWSPLSWGAGNGPTTFGPELSFGRILAQGAPEARVALIKHAEGGTNLAVDWDPSTGPSYANLVDVLAQAKARADAYGLTYEVRGFAWMQGESDALDANMAFDYTQNFPVFIEGVRALVGVPDLPIVFGRIRETMPTPFDFASDVRAAQESVAAADPNVTFVDTDDLTLKADEVHYDAAALVTLGERFADAMKQLAPP